MVREIRQRSERLGCEEQQELQERPEEILGVTTPGQ